MYGMNGWCKPDGDLISRAAAIDAMEQAKEQYFDRRVIIGKMQDIVNNLPSAQPEKRTEKRTETHACDLIDRQPSYSCSHENDTISRTAAIDALRTHERKASKKWFDNQLDIEWNNAIDICCYDIEDLPSVQADEIRKRRR